MNYIIWTSVHISEIHIDSYKSPPIRHGFFAQSTGEFRLDYWVMATDYDNYAFCYGCGSLHQNDTCDKPHAWIWSRRNSLDPANETTVRGLVQGACMDYDEDFTLVPQDNGIIKHVRN